MLFPLRRCRSDVILTVVDKFLVELQAQLDDKKVVLNVDDAARRWLVENGYDKTMGARPMARIIQQHIKKPLAEMVLFGSLEKCGGVVSITVKGDGLALTAETVDEEESQTCD